MPGPKVRGGALGLALLLGVSPFLTALANPPAPSKLEDYKGKVVPLAAVLKELGARLDADASPYWFALVSEDGKVYPLIKDSGSRMFHTDVRLLNRPMRLTGRVLPGTQLLQVLAVHSYVKGELHDVYYWCEVCSIRRGEKGICECCGGPMDLREVPVRK